MLNKLMITLGKEKGSLNILFLTIAYPESAEDTNLYTDLMQELSERGNKVHVVTSCERRYRKKTTLGYKNGISILRVKTGNLTKTNFFEKGISSILLERQFKSAINKYYGSIEFDLLIYSTPPVTFNSLIKFFKKSRSVKTYLLLKDIFPQNAVDLGLLKKNSLLYSLFRKKEISLYCQSDFIGCMSPNNVKYLLQNNPFLQNKIVEVCPNSIYPDNNPINDKDKQLLRKKYNISSESTIFLYGGNLGKPQGIHFLFDIIKSQKDNRKVFFIIVGSGTEYGSIRQNIQQYGINNTLLLEHLPKKEFDSLVQACDAGLIFLDRRFTIPNFPSRLLSYMQFSLPVIAATDKNTDIGTIIQDGNFGYWCESEDLDSFNSIINSIVSDKDALKLLGINARNYLLENYTVKTSCDIILKHFTT